MPVLWRFRVFISQNTIFASFTAMVYLDTHIFPTKDNIYKKLTLSHAVF